MQVHLKKGRLSHGSTSHASSAAGSFSRSPSSQANSLAHISKRSFRLRMNLSDSGEEYFHVGCHSGGVGDVTGIRHWLYHKWWASPGLFFLPNSPSLPLSTPNAFCVSFPGGSVESDSLQMWFIYRPVIHILSGLLRFPHWDHHR